MERHQLSNSPLKTTLFAVAALFLCGLMALVVSLQGLVFYVYRPAIVEPVLIFIVMVFSIVGAYQIVAPNSALSPWISALIPIAVFTAYSVIPIIRANLSIVTPFVIAAAVVAGLTVHYLRRQEVKSRRRQALTGVLLIVTCIVLIEAARTLFMVDIIG